MPGLPPTRLPPWTRYAGIGIEYAGAVACFTLVGWWVDARWDTSPWGVLFGVGLGLIGATYNLVRSAMAAFREVKPKKGEDAEGEHDRHRDD